MGDTGGSICKITSGKYDMERGTVEDVCVVYKTKPVHLPFFLYRTLMLLCSAGN